MRHFRDLSRLVAVSVYVCHLISVANDMHSIPMSLKFVTWFWRVISKWMGVWCCLFLSLLFPLRLESDAVIRALSRIYVLLKVSRRSVPCAYLFIDILR